MYSFQSTRCKIDVRTCGNPVTSALSTELPYPPESTALTAAMPVTLGVILIAVVGTVSATMMYCFKSGRLKTLHRRTHDEMCINPKIQLLQMS